MISYTQIRNNINKRVLTMDVDTYSKVITNLEDIMNNSKSLSERISSRVLLDKLTEEYLYYEKLCETAQTGSQIIAVRRIEKELLLDDRFANLINCGICANTTYPNLMTINLNEHLDILLSFAFSVDLKLVRDSLTNFCENRGIDLKALSLLTLLGKFTPDEDVSLTVKDLCDISSNIYEFFYNLYRKKKSNTNISYLDCIQEDIKYSEIFSTSPEDEILGALKVKLYLAANVLLQQLACSFYNNMKEKYKGIIFSQYLMGITFNTALPIEDDFIENINGSEIVLPKKIITKGGY